MTRSPARILKRVSLCSSLAIATSLVVGPSPAAAQAFQGTVDSSSGISAPVIGSGTTTIDVTAQQAVINWTATGTSSGGVTTFQSSGTTATFQGASDFAVLNRVSPSVLGDGIFMDGMINSLVGGQVGGTVYFYSPNGIVIGQNASINVGSLGLTTSPIADDGEGSWMGGFGTSSPSVTFGAANPGSYVRTDTAIDGSINANGFGSYVALVAPIVQHNGVIRTDSGAALVGAEAATITFNQDGLYNIEVTTGTDGGVTVDGGTITRNSQTIGGDRHAYLVAVPKNNAITLLVTNGAELGFDIAGSAGVEGNSIVLSAGHDISFGSTSIEPSPASGALADINVTNSNFTSALYGRASGEAIVGASGGGSSSFTSDVSLRAGSLVQFTSGNPESSVTVGGNLTLSANADASNDGDSVTAGNVQLMAFDGGSLSVTGDTNLSAIGTGGFSSNPSVASGDGIGGIILVQSTTGGDLSLAGTLSADARGIGGSFFDIDGLIDGGSGFGGTVNVFTSGGASMTVTGDASLIASGQAGQGSDCFQCGDIGGIGDAGTINVQAHTGPSNTMDFLGSLGMTANGIGGDGQSGGDGLGGDVTFSATGSSTVTVAGDVLISASGSGGRAFGADGDGGDGFGGDVDVLADTNGSLDIAGSVSEFLDGNGGDSEGGNGGFGQGGFGELFSNGGTVSVGLYSSIFADGRGGDGLASGGEGQGGSAYFSSSNGGTLTLGSFSSLITDGFGGDAFDADGLGGNGGLGEGGHAEAYANDAVLDIQGTLVLSADGEGGDAGGGRDAGDSLGGDIYLQAIDGGSLSVAGGLYASAVGIGDYTSSSTTNSGDGTGGFIGIYARDGDSTLTVSGSANLNADGKANDDGECFPCGGIGGIGQGGNIIIASQGATGVNGNILDLGANLFATADGYGGNGVGGAAGDGFGGTVRLTVADGNSVNVTGLATLEATGWGGYDFAGLVGGSGTGGTAQISTLAGNAGNSITLGGAIVDASGWGGDSGSFVNGDGGDGTGGTARMYSPAGTIHVSGDLTLEAEGYGGDSDGVTGIGGDGFGKLAELVADGGDITIDGSAFVDASGYGGDAFDAGDGFGGGDPDLAPEDQTDGAYIFARNGDISIGVGDVETGAFMESNGYGGFGLDNGSSGGGSGGNGSGGFVSMLSGNSNLGASSITAEMTFLSATGEGGDGGDGSGGGSGDPGGDGGIGTGGFAGQTAAAGNGLLDIGSAFVNVSALGGSGGDGGSADGGTGGDGGNGGAAIGGFSNVGTSSHTPSIAQAGVGNFGSITIDASAVGGNAGNGGIFGSPDGNGGAGGSATGGRAVLLVRGSTLNVGTVNLFGDATGGNGGSGAVEGVGGNALGGSAGVVVTKRFQDTPRGQLNAGRIFGDASATGGFGSTNGASMTGGDSLFQVTDSDASIGSLEFIIDAADGASPGAPVNAIRVVNGAVEITGGFDDFEAFYPGDFSFITPGDMSLFADNGSMTVDNILTLTAGNFVPDINGEPPLNAGTYFANLINITSGLNIYTTANLDSILGLNLTAPGFVVAGNLNGNAGDVIVDAQGGLIDVGNIDGGFVNLQATDSIATGDINSGSNIQATSGTDMTLGNLFAGVTIDQNSSKAVRLDSGGSILVGDITALGGIDFSANGSMTGGNVITGDMLGGDADGAVTFGAISAGLINPQGPTEDGFSVGFSSGTSISVGDVAGAEGVGFATLGSLTTGDISAGTDVLAMASGNMSFGAITAGPAGRTYLADSSMFTAAGGPDNFEPSLVFGASPVASSGSITILGPVSTGQFQANAGTFLSAGAITAGLNIDITSGGNMTLGNLVAGLDPSAGDAVGLDSGGSILVGNVTAAGGIDFSAAGSVTGLNITTGYELGGDADGAVSLGNISAGLVNPQGPVADGFSVELSSGTSISVGSVAGAEGISFASLGALTTANIAAGTDVLAMASGNMNLGDLLAGTSIALDAGGNMAFGNATAQAGSVQASAVGAMTFLDISAGTFVTIDPTDIVGGDVTALAGDVDLTGDSIDIGNVSASDNVLLTALAGDLSTGTIDAGFDVTLDASGDVATGNITAGGLIDATGASLTLGNLSANSIALTTTVADLTVGNVTIPGDLALTTAGDLIFGDLIAFDVDLAATGGISGGDIDSATDITALAGTSLSLGNLDAGGFFIETFLIGNISLTAGGDITTLAQSAFGDVLMDADGDIATGDITGGSITAFAGGDIDTGDLTTQQLAELFSFVPGVSIWLDSGGDITTGDISSFDSVHTQAVGGIATGAIDAQGFVELFGGGAISTADILAGDYIDIFTSGGTIALGDLDAGNQIELDATGAISFGNAVATDFDFDGGGSVTGGNIVASQIAGGQAQGAITLQNISAGSDIEFVPDDGFSVGMASETSITVGDVTGAHAVGFATLGPLATGDIDAGEGLMALVGGNMNLGSITTDPTGRVYLADASMFLAAGGPDDFDPSLVLAAEPVATGGSITINGPVSTGIFQAAAGTGLSAGAITAQSIDASAGGTATVNGNWSASEITLASNDIDITASGFLNAGLAGPLTLISTNATQALIGDGLTGTGYALSNAEFGRLHGGAVSVLANGGASAAQDMLIGDLSITGPLAGSTIDNPNGIVVFATGDLDTLTPGGVIRVVGDVEATGFQPGNALEFYADMFELDAATGSVSITSSGGALSGELGLYADQIHVAEASILDQLAANPQYAGYQDDLNAPAAVQRPDGVLKAAAIWIESDNLQNILIQNTGTEETPAGFLAQEIFVNDDEEIAGPPSSIDLVVNGQLQTEGGTLIGIAVRDALVEGEDLTPFTDNSTINGCLLVGPCGVVPPPPIDPVGGIAAEITLISKDVLSEQPFGNEPVIDDQEGTEDDESSSPIEPPAPLFDTRPLNPDADVDEPISGSGNPALMGAGPVTDGDQQ